MGRLFLLRSAAMGLKICFVRTLSVYFSLAKKKFNQALTFLLQYIHN